MKKSVRALVGLVLLDAIIIGDGKIRIIGSNDNIAAAVGGASKPKRVRNSVQEWCPRPDSNQHAREGNRF